MPACPYCGAVMESSPPSTAANVISAHVPKCPLNPANRPPDTR